MSPESSACRKVGESETPTRFTLFAGKRTRRQIFAVVLPSAPAVLRLKSGVNQIKEPEKAAVVVKVNHI